MMMLVGGCSKRQFTPGSGPDPVTVVSNLPPQPLDQVLVLEVSGVSPTDTTVRFAARAGRTVLLRHAPPDNAVFAIVSIPPDSAATDEITLTLHPLPGQYGLRVQAAPRLPPDATVAFSYAVHFQAPSTLPGSRYAGTTAYSQWLGIGRLDPDGRELRFLAFTRPAADMVRAPAAQPGEYLVAAPR